jgi:hypothetical protein
MSLDERAAAQARVADLVTLLRSVAGAETARIIAECESLDKAIAAFHMEGIRFRIFNVDRMLSRAGAAVPPEAAALLEQARGHLEAAGFHTRSHQAPT